MTELFLSFAGQDEAAVREKAKKLVAQARGGADFVKLAVENSDRQNVAETKGKVDPIAVRDLDPKFAEAIKNLKVGGISDPVEIGQVGISIVRIDERAQPTSESQFDENAVRLAMLNEKLPDAQKKYMSKLREDSYIKISDTYRPLVSPILFADDRTSAPKTANK